MTREEAIKKLKYCKSIHNGSYGDVLKIAIKSLEQTRWISVSERLPEEGKDVLSCFIDGQLDINRIINNNNQEWLFDEQEVIAWMPLPEPYRAESEVE